jgi:hypothetical protein
MATATISGLQFPEPLHPMNSDVRGHAQEEQARQTRASAQRQRRVLRNGKSGNVLHKTFLHVSTEL